MTTRAKFRLAAPGPEPDGQRWLLFGDSVRVEANEVIASVELERTDHPGWRFIVDVQLATGYMSGLQIRRAPGRRPEQGIGHRQMLRTLTIDDMTRFVRRTALQELKRARDKHGLAVTGPLDELLESSAGVRRGRLTDERDLARFMRDYRNAIARGETKAQFLDRVRGKESTFKKRWERAKELGLIESAGQGRRGLTLTDKATRLLDEGETDAR